MQFAAGRAARSSHRPACRLTRLTESPITTTLDLPPDEPSLSARNISTAENSLWAKRDRRDGVMLFENSSTQNWQHGCASSVALRPQPAVYLEQGTKGRAGPAGQVCCLAHGCADT